MSPAGRLKKSIWQNTDLKEAGAEFEIIKHDFINLIQGY